MKSANHEICLECRKLLSADAEDFKDLRIEGARAFPEAFLLTVEEAEQSDLDELRKAMEGGTLWGLFDAAKMIGFAGLAQRPWATARHRAGIGPFYVTSSYHGTGAAQTLIDAVADHAKSLGVLQLELWVWDGNTRAIRFYERNGFERSGVMPRAVIIDGKGRDDFFYIRALDR